VHPLLPRGKLFFSAWVQITFEHTRLLCILCSTACIVSQHRSNDTALLSLLGERQSIAPNASCRLAPSPIVRSLLHFTYSSRSTLFSLSILHVFTRRASLCQLPSTPSHCTKADAYCRRFRQSLLHLRAVFLIIACCTLIEHFPSSKPVSASTRQSIAASSAISQPLLACRRRPIVS